MAPLLQIEHKVVALEIRTSRAKEQFREELVLAAFTEALHTREAGAAAVVAKAVVEYADAVLAAMAIAKDENPETEQPDTGPPADSSALGRIRAEIQTRFDVDARVHANNPTTIVRAQGYREGFADCSKNILAMIDEEMEKPEAEDADAK